ncbi:MAG TPA: prepilin-type N-terminal cleavage/methylation domain-containing protein [Bryobacteraceae bacterium]|jgi:type IV pilus assembly protein PilA|nr:prepilin-type N-terminal cleavage/methylation domain-containing protein [Bryobacteraceae bacterium]
MLNLKSDSTSRRRQAGFSLVELLVVIAIILIILFFAVPQYNKARMNAQETGAIAGLKTIYQAEIQYQSEFGDFATSLAQLGPPAATGGTEGPSSAGLIAGGLAGGNSSGYVFTVTQTPTGYSVTAVPKTFNSTGRRTFYSDQSGIVRQNWGSDPATANSPEVK